MLSRVLLGGYGGHSEPGKTRLDPNADTSSSYYPHGRFLSIRLSVVPISIDGTIKRTETLCRVGFPSVARLIRAHSVDPYLFDRNIKIEETKKNIKNDFTDFVISSFRV